MSQAGWYPDPGGAPGRFRFWDGQGWSAETTVDPSAPPPVPGGPAQQPKPRGVGLLLAGLIVAVVLVLVIVLLIRNLDGNGTALTDPNPPQSTVSGWDDSSPIPTDPPTASASPTSTQSVSCADAAPEQRAQHPNDGRLYGGRLSIPQPGGAWVRNDRYAQVMTWAYDVSGASERVESNWYSMVAVGLLREEDGFRTPKQAADGVLQCIATSSYYQYFTGRTDLVSEKVTIDGAKGWSIRSEIRVDNPDVEAEGDVVQVIVLDTGPEGSLSYFSGFVSIGDQARIQILDDTIADLQVV